LQKDLKMNVDSQKEEMASAITHGIGVGLSIWALVLLVMKAVDQGNVYHVVSFTVFGSALITVYLTSTLFHAIRVRRVKKFFNLMDHAAIYFLIAGTYTPITLGPLRGPWGWSIFGVIWGLAVAGIIFKVFFIGKFRTLSAFLYVAMGWAIIVAVKPLLETMPENGLWLLLAGGLSYSGGVVFYILKDIPYAHSIWHLFVLGGSVCHFLSIYLYVI
jgi:hemolysin III